MAYNFDGDDPIYAQIAEYMEYCEFVRQMSPMTITAKKSCYKQFIEQSNCKDLRELTNKEFNRFIKGQTANGVSPRTINMRQANLLAMFRYHREMGMNMPIKLPLIQKLKEGKVRRVFYEREDIEKVLATIDLHAKNEWILRGNMMDWLLIRVCFDSGLRISELRNLELANFNGRRINIVGKGYKPGEVYVASETYKILQKWIKLAGVDKWLWIDEYHRHLGTDELRIRMRKIFEQAGFDNFYPHALRHSFCTDIQKQGATIMEMQQMLRHANAQTTEIYSHGFDGQKAALFNKYRETKLIERKNPLFSAVQRLSEIA